MIVEIKEGKNKPYKCREGFFIRIGPNAQKMGREKIIDLALSGGRIRFDEQVNHAFDFEKDFDEEMFRQFLKENNLFTGLDTKDILISLGLAGGQDNINNAGILFFAKNPQKFFVHAYLDCVLFKGKDKSIVLDRKTFRTNLFGQLSSAKLFVEKHLDLGYRFDGFERHEEYEIPLRVIEEALVNALMHRDYFFKGANISLFIYDDRIEIISPGGLPRGLDKKDFGRLSVRRNQIIADIFSKTPYVEQMGSGIKRMRILLKEADLSAPVFEMNRFFIITIKRKLKMPSERAGENVPLNDRQKKAVEYIKEHGKINRVLYCNINNVKKSVAYEELKFMVTKMIIEQIGKGKATYYVFSGRLADDCNRKETNG